MSYTVFSIPIISANKDYEPKEAYNTFYPDQSKEEIFSKLTYVAKYEYDTFLQLLDTHYPDRKWVKDLNFQFLEEPTKRTLDPDNFILKQLSYSDAGCLAQILLKSVEELSDVYEKDHELNLMLRVFIITYDGKYLGHVYLDDDGLIGIRTSLLNLFTKQYSGLAYILLDAYRTWALETGIEQLSIVLPIGPMQYIAKKYGFNKDYIFITGETPKISVPEYELVSY